MAIKAVSSTDNQRFVQAVEFQQRRAELARQCGPDSVVIIMAAAEVTRNADSHYPYRQNSDFYYVTGFEEPDAIAVLLNDEKQSRYLLFVRQRDASREVWDGPRAGVEGAKRDYLADEAYPLSEFQQRYPDLLKNRKMVYCHLGQDDKFESHLLHELQSLQIQARAGVQAPQALHNLKGLLSEMRLVKSPAEINALQRASDITVAAHQRAMKAARVGMREYELEAEIMHEFYRNGSRSPAYTNIVGSGANACVLHYIQNNSVINDNELILIDAGAEIENYAADVTRTFPVSGKFTVAQKQIYELVLKAQLAIIAVVKPGLLWSRMQEMAVDVIVDGLLDLGILTGLREQIIEDKDYQRFYMHRSGHWLGLDVHDAGAYVDAQGQCRVLQPGMVFTVEPGIYIAAGSEGVDEKWWDIGVRIEDDVLVTDEGAVVLTDAAPKTVADIEALMQR